MYTFGKNHLFIQDHDDVDDNDEMIFLLISALGIVPTSIVTEDLSEQEAFVLSPSHLSCNYSGDSRISYRRVMPGLHEKREFQFMLGIDGILRHPCSGRMVCPDAYMEYLIVSKHCNAENAKFERTAVCTA